MLLQDLNLQPLLHEQLDSSYDVVLCVNGIQYLTQPETVLAEVRTYPAHTRCVQRNLSWSAQSSIGLTNANLIGKACSLPAAAEPCHQQTLFEVLKLTNSVAAAIAGPSAHALQASRVLQPGGLLVVTFGPYCFREKATAGWLARDVQERTQLLKE